MKKILVPCDFSDPSRQAFKFAIAIAAAAKADVYLFHVVEIPVLHSSMAVPVQTYEKSYLKSMSAKYNKNVEKMIEQWGGKVKVRSVVEFGSVESGVKKFAENKKVDLIVMGTHGANGIKNFVVGSNTEKIVRSSKIPVIAIKKAPQLSSIKNLVFPSDLAEVDKKPIAFVKDLQNLLKAKLHILFINNPENFVTNLQAEKSLAQFASDNQFKNFTLNIYNDLTEEKGIANFSLGFKKSMIVMSTHGRKGLNHFFNGSIAEEVVNNIDSPILTFHG